MKEYFEKIHIKSEDDLPKKEMPYLGKDEKGIHWIGYYPTTSEFFEYEKDHWLNLVDWYLRPIEQKPDCYEKEFVEWSHTLKDSGTIFHNPDGLYSLGDFDLTLDELHDYWISNIKG